MMDGSKAEKVWAVTAGCRARMSWFRRLGQLSLMEAEGVWLGLALGDPGLLGRFVPSPLEVITPEEVARAWREAQRDVRRCSAILAEAPSLVDIMVVLRNGLEWNRFLVKW